VKKVFIQLRIAPEAKSGIVKALKRHPGETITSVMLRGAELAIAELDKAAARKAKRKAKG
jgi:hypothetical protein